MHHQLSILSIRPLRIKAGLTQAALAKRIGIKSVTLISMWESGHRKPSSLILPSLAEALNCSVDELFRRDA